VTTKPKGQRRLMLARQKDGPVSKELDWQEWATAGEDPRASAADLARMHYLQALRHQSPKVLNELKRINADDDAALAAWVTRWRLGRAWAPAWARTTIRLSGGRYWCPPTEGEGALIGTEHPVTRTRTAREIAWAAPLVHENTFKWLAQYQVLERPFLTIAIQAQALGNAGVSAGNVRRDCARLAALLDIPIRVTRRGRRPAKKHARSAPNE
jgi:hypothetical protein